MWKIPSILCLVLLLALGTTTGATPVVSEILMLAEASDGVTDAEFAALIGGYADAFRTPWLVDYLSDSGGIAATLVLWSGPDEQEQVVPWMVVNDAPSAEAIANAIEGVSRPAFTTLTASISGVLDWAANPSVFDSEFEGRQRIIDISGESENNDDPEGLGLPEARDRALGNSDQINALVFAPPGSDMVNYYRENVIGGIWGGIAYGFADYGENLAGVLSNKVIREAQVIPEPGTLSLAVLGLVGLLGWRLRRRR